MVQKTSKIPSLYCLKKSNTNLIMEVRFTFNVQNDHKVVTVFWTMRGRHVKKASVSTD